MESEETDFSFKISSTVSEHCGLLNVTLPPSGHPDACMNIIKKTHGHISERHPEQRNRASTSPISQQIRRIRPCVLCVCVCVYA